MGSGKGARGGVQVHISFREVPRETGRRGVVPLKRDHDHTHHVQIREREGSRVISMTALGTVEFWDSFHRRVSHKP